MNLANKTLVLVLFFALSFSAFNAIAQEEKFGSRPTINYELIDINAVDLGIIYIKVNSDIVENFDGKPSILNKNDICKIGIPAIDYLFDFYQVNDIQPLFPKELFNDTSKDHRSLWGFDRWYALKISETLSPIEAAKEFAKLSEIELAEPVFKIIRMNGEGSWELVENSSRNPFIYKDNKKELFDKNKPNQTSNKWLPNDPYFSQQAWHYNKISMQEAWNIHNGGDNVIVSIHDGGIQFVHPDLSANIWGPIGPDGSYTIADSHGTHVAGTVAAVSNNNLGVAGIAGGDGSGNGARLMSVDIFNGTFSTYQGYVYAAQNGASVSQNSWSYQNANVYNAADLEGIDYFYNFGGGDLLAGGVIVFAAGNDNSSQNWYPAFYEKTIAVAATNQMDAKATFSNYGTWVDISAPGVSIYSTDTNSSYSTKQGTSMACPHVSGVAALVISIAPRVLTNEMVRDILMTSSDDHYQINQDYVGLLGAGRLNAFNAIQMASAYAIDNPLSFVSEAISKTTIELTWNLNDDSMPILLAYNTTNNFGIPLYEYSEGNEIQGGGKVLYYGNQTSFLHQELEPGTTYYYKLWSFNGSNYSAGLFAATTTICNIFGVPFSIGFDDAVFPNCWGNVSHTEPEIKWLVSNTFGGMYGSGIYYYFLLDSYGFGAESVQDADLVSPEFDFSDEGSVYLSFNHYYRHRPDHRVSLHYSIDGGENWVEKNAWESDTQNPEQYIQRISEVEGENSVYFKWNYQGSWGYFWCVDSIRVTSNPLGIDNNNATIDDLKVYPNPFKNILTVNVPAHPNTTIVNVYNIFGSLVYSSTFNSTKTIRTIEIDLGFLPNGAYIIECKGSNLIQRARILKL